MTRKKFITNVGFGILVLTGISGIVKRVSALGQHEDQATRFGSGPYGGKENA